MKRIILFFILNIITVSSFSQAAPGAMDFTIKGGPAANQIQVFVTPRIQNYFGKFGQLILPIGFLNSCITTFPTITADQTGAVQFSLQSTGIVRTVTGQDATTYQYTTISFDIGGQADVNYVVGTEYLLTTLTFSGGAPNNCAIGLMDFADGGDPIALDGNMFAVEIGNYWNQTAYGNALFYNGIVTPPNTIGSTATNNGLSGDNFVWLNSAITLPIQLIDFTAIKNAAGNAVTLKWEVAAEDKTERYEVYRGVNDPDESRFTLIATVPATNSKNYSTIDNNPANGTNYYRLHSIDADGKRHIEGAIRTVVFGNSTSLFKMTPNLLTAGNNKSVLNFQQNKYAGAADVIVTDLAGKRVQVSRIAVMKGTTITDFRLNNNVTAGTYLVTVLDANGNKLAEPQKLVKQ